jgi:hypothetical protein
MRGQGRCIECFVGRFEGRRLLGRPMRRWKDNIKMGAWTELVWLRMTGGRHL